MVGDAGLANERTSLAWTRTALGLALVGAVILKAGARVPVASIPVGVGLIVFAAATGLRGASAYRGRLEGTAVPLPRVGALREVAAATLIAAVTGFAIALDP